MQRAKGTVQFHADEGIRLPELQEMSYRILRAKSAQPSAQGEAGQAAAYRQLKGSWKESLMKAGIILSDSENWHSQRELRMGKNK